jgi:hypothetical protein
MANQVSHKAQIGRTINGSPDYAQWQKAVMLEGARLGVLAHLQAGDAGREPNVPARELQAWRNLKDAIIKSLGTSVRAWLENQEQPDLLNANAGQVLRMIRVQFENVSVEEQIIENESILKVKFLDGDGTSKTDIRSYVADVHRRMVRLPSLYPPQPNVPAANALVGHLLRHLKKSMPPSFGTVLELLSQQWVQGQLTVEAITASLVSKFQELLADGKYKTVDSTYVTLVGNSEDKAWVASSADGVSAIEANGSTSNATSTDGMIMLTKSQLKRKLKKAKKEGGAALATGSYGKGKGKDKGKKFQHNDNSGYHQKHHNKHYHHNNGYKGNNYHYGKYPHYDYNYHGGHYGSHPYGKPKGQQGGKDKGKGKGGKGYSYYTDQYYHEYPIDLAADWQWNEQS